MFGIKPRLRQKINPVKQVGLDCDLPCVTGMQGGQRRVEGVKRAGYVGARPPAFHGRPMLGNSGLEVRRQPTARRNSRCFTDAMRQSVNQSRGSGLSRDRIRSVVERLKHDNHREPEQHVVKHTERGELEAGDLVVRGKALKAGSP